MKTVNIDEHLKEKGVQFILNGKTFTVTDVNEEVGDKISQLGQGENIKPREIAKDLLGCEDEDLNGYGIATFNYVIQETTRNLFESNSPSDQSEG